MIIRVGGAQYVIAEDVELYGEENDELMKVGNHIRKLLRLDTHQEAVLNITIKNVRTVL